MTSREKEEHSRNSMLREIIVEHIFIGNLLRCLWINGILDAEILRSEFDAGGYDLMLSRGDIVRHIQMKTRLLSGKARDVSVSLGLAARPAGCVVWLILTENLDIDHIMWFGSGAREPLPNLDGYTVTKHTKGDSVGLKKQRQNHRKVPIRAFTRLESINELAQKMLGLP